MLYHLIEYIEYKIKRNDRQEDRHKNKLPQNQKIEIMKLLQDDPLHKAVALIKYIMIAQGSQICHTLRKLKRQEERFFNNPPENRIRSLSTSFISS